MRRFVSVRTRSRWLALLPAVAASCAALLASPAPAWACPSCASAMDPQVQEGFFWGLVFMMASPWLAVGTIGGGLYLAVRRARREAVEEFLRSEGTAVAVAPREPGVGEA